MLQNIYEKKTKIDHTTIEILNEKFANSNVTFVHLFQVCNNE